MKELFTRPSFLQKVEFWAATVIFVFSLFYLNTGNANSNVHLFKKEGVPFDYYRNFIFPEIVQYVVLYLTFLFLNFKVIPRLIEKENLVLNIFWVVLTFLATGVVLGITNTYLQRYVLSRFELEEDGYYLIFQNSFSRAFALLLMLGLYVFVKFASLYILANSETLQNRYKVLTRDTLTAIIAWMVSMFLLVIIDADGELILTWGLIGPFGILFYSFSFYRLLPNSLGKKRPFISYVGKSFVWLAVSFFPLTIFMIVVSDSEEDALGFAAGNALFQLFVTVPLCWMLYKRHIQGNEEVQVLQKELGRSNAKLDFLRSQINPHFLFNTLNTLYGTALQENSERTAQGIQMLGDIMRFMLHENHQHKILLSREIDYMRNYIALQSLRTSYSPEISIHTNIENVLSERFIAPMLLIPFVENAFKHGISLKQKSWIKVSLHMEDTKLYFNVYNSKHPKPALDPEEGKSGVGLENVKQRLSLLYDNKHELVIRETIEEYFVHLTLQL
ncbi:sensor histidine kinase [Pontibacter sp. SGAir0037]|uniref:sensor histidine kinase n=1 Tax=Pontibacter sp. SGAir0037 TaxID=2571030 RepID=UPI0010CCFBCC|nr:histidine kinase [Pontibacter sp. SGAir0037]QCR22761.1 sensor histidine kinase [Pontibacter sp. SGAir0037]